ncbi:MAG: 6,7-dimethyl-8-ribityllumazine synthase [Pseudomonadota bacterium]
MNQIITMLPTDNNASSSVFHNTRIAIVSAMWHQDIVSKAREGLFTEFDRHQFPNHQIDQFEVPGAFEIPLFVKKLTQTTRYSAIIACGLIVDGGIYRHEFVAAAVIDGLMRIQIQSGIPILSVVLTPKDFHENSDHHRFFSEHFIKKGIEAASACLNIIAGLKKLESINES